MRLIDNGTLRPFFADDKDNLVTDQAALFKLREEMTTDRLARIMAVSPRSIENWCQGRRRPGKPALRLLQAYLD